MLQAVSKTRFNAGSPARLLRSSGRGEERGGESCRLVQGVEAGSYEEEGTRWVELTTASAQPSGAS